MLCVSARSIIRLGNRFRTLLIAERFSVHRSLSCLRSLGALKMSPTTLPISENSDKNIKIETNGVCPETEIEKGTCQFLKDWKEVEIPVPWGCIAGKAWGDSTGYPVLGLHGWQDNCGTFDKLAPLLPDSFYFVAIDLPGHGMSSQYPPGMTYGFQDMLLHIKFVAEHLKWKKFSLLGHSMGGAVSMMFGALLPNLIDRAVSIDLIKPIGYDTKIHPEKTVRAISMYFDILKKMEGSPPAYSYEEAKKRLLIANAGSLTPDSADILMIRGTKKNDDGGYFFSRDLRQTLPGIVSTTNDQLRELFSRVKVPLMIIKGSQGPLYEPEELYEEFVEIYRKSSSQFEYVEVEGTHHLHLNTPENAAPHIIRFLEPVHMAAL